MLNINNTCRFFGRITKDLQITTVNSSSNSFSKLSFTLAVQRNISKQQEQNNPNIQKADFVPCVATGKTAELIEKYFQKGSPIQILGSYQSYTKQDSSGNTVYGHVFKVEEIGFPINNSNDSSSSNNKNSRNKNDDDDFYPMGDEDTPF